MRGRRPRLGGAASTGGGPVSDMGFRYHRMRDPDLVANRTLDRTVVRRVWTFARPYRLLLSVLLASILLASLLAILPPLVFREIIDRHAIPRRDLGGINRLAFLALMLAVADAGMGVVQRWLSARIGEGLIFNLRSALYDHVQRMPLAFFTRTQTGALISRMNNDVIGAQQAFTGTLGTVVQNVFEVVATLGVMIGLEWRLTLLALGVVPAFLIPAKRVGRGMQKLTRESFQLDAAMNNNMTERFNVSGALLVKLFGSPERESSEFADRAARVRDIGVRRALYSRVFFTALALLGAVGTVAVYWWGSRLVFSGAISVGTLTALAVYVSRVYRPLTSLTNAHVDVMTALVSFERVFEVLDAPHPLADAPDAVDLVDPKGRIEFDDVWFRYPAASAVSIASLEAAMTTPLSDEPSGMILKGVSFVAEPGQMVALVGPTGAGKTTTSHLVPRLYDVVAGAVRVDGHDVRQLTGASLTGAIGMVTQDPHMFHDTIAANLRYARPEATDDELMAACRAARIHDLIASLPEGYDTMVGERGYRLSGGEKQRLALARVLLKSPSIVILDEATAHLDSETEVLIQQALDEALAGRTSLVIAHRLSTIQAADQILVIDGGRVVERGTHDELSTAGGLYQELYLTQYARTARPPSTPSGERRAVE
jgi:ATP-binding cassette, subfamily B, bacterial